VLLVGAANVGEHLRIGPTGVDCGATSAVYASSEGACCSVGSGLPAEYCIAVPGWSGWAAGGVC
jgi:hypothetical protein